MKYEIKWDVSRWKQLVAKFPKTLAEACRLGLLKGMTDFREYFRERQLRGRPGLNRRTSALFNSFALLGSPKGAGLNDVWAKLASSSKYALIHETGGTIRPKRRKFLAIPLPTAQAKAGAMRGNLVGLDPAGGTTPSLYGVKGLVLFKSKAGNLLLGEPKPGGIVPLFVLKRSVTIPPRLGFLARFKEWVAAGNVRQRLAEAVGAAWKTAKASGRL